MRIINGVFCWVVVVLLLSGTSVYSAAYEARAKLLSTDLSSDDTFGDAGSLSGDTAVVGAYYKSSGTGSAYVFSRDQRGANMWGQVQKLMPSDVQLEDLFGRAVSISGDTIVVGAYGEDSGGASAGAAYVFSRNQGGANAWGQVQKLMASDAQASDFFGRAVSVSGDTIVVGAYNEDTPAFRAGSAYVFQRDQGGANAWGQVAKLQASDGQAYDYFGYSVSISSDTVAIGAYGEDSEGEEAGAVYVFSRNQGGANAWGQLKKLIGSDTKAYDYFGYSVSISGDTIAVGAHGEDSGGDAAGAAYVFSRNQGGANAWGQIKKLTASDPQDLVTFGNSVSISGDSILIGASIESTKGRGAGAAYVFSRDQGGANAWGLVQKLMALDAQPYDYFGTSVSIAGNMILIGAPNEDSGGFNAGAAYIFEAGVRTVPNDFDGDGLSDIGCYYPPTGGWFIFKSASQSLWTTQFGFEGTLPITGDFDGDAISDFGCYYPVDGSWFIFKSSTESLWTTQFGFDGTTPVVGDYDGDGKDDFGCYYPPTGGWFIYKSTTGLWTTQFGYEGTIAIQ